nr:MAG TPA: hypothetical protein [Bacteriophage sp.]
MCIKFLYLIICYRLISRCIHNITHKLYNFHIILLESTLS